MGGPDQPPQKIQFSSEHHSLMNAVDFSKQVIETSSQYGLISEIDILLLDEPVVKIRAFIHDNIFIDIFYNAETNKYSFALISGNERIFGADNLRFWHIHPFEDPESHIETAPVGFLDFLEMLKSSKEKWLPLT